MWETLTLVHEQCRDIAREQKFVALRLLEFSEYEQHIFLESTAFSLLTLLQEKLMKPEEIFQEPKDAKIEGQREGTHKTPD